MIAAPIITGLGLLTPLGRSPNETWQSLLAGGSIRDHARLQPLEETSIPRVTALAIEAARQAVADAGWTDHPIAPEQTAIVVGTSKGPIESWLTLPSTSDNIEPAGGSSFGLADVAAQLAAALGFIASPRLTLSAACASGLHALIRAALMIQSGEISRALVVAAEASVHPLFLASFRRLGVLPPPGVPCRPFDENRRGFLMSEAAAAICVEADHHDKSNAKQIGQSRIAIERFAMAGDATHMTAGDPTGAILQHLLTQVIADQPVDLIHAHGTGTVFNDPVELNAIDQSIAPHQRPPIIYSHKGALGHSLGAAGLISIVINCLCHRCGKVPPNPNTPNPLRSKIATVSPRAIRRSIHRSLACASGFGGSMAVISLIG